LRSGVFMLILKLTSKNEVLHPPCWIPSFCRHGGFFMSCV